jgi:photosystem II stability/assembly factor-like uncharacterized protein
MSRLALLFAIFSYELAQCQVWKEIEMSIPATDTLLVNSSIKFADKNVAWIVSGGYIINTMPPSQYTTRIFKTRDGGYHWQLQKVLDSTMVANSFIVLDSSHCYIVGLNSTLLFTIDGGTRWDTSYIPTQGGDRVSVLHFFDPQNGIAFSSYRWMTRDGGQTWEKDGDSAWFFSPSDVQFVNRQLGWMVSASGPRGSDAGYIANTTDGGQTWTYQDSLTGILLGVDFADSLAGYAVGTNVSYGTGFVYSTTDGGNMWALRQDYTSGPMLDVGFMNASTGWITGVAGGLWQTTDGGAQWALQSTNTNATLRKIYILHKDSAAYIFGGSPRGRTTYSSPFLLLCADLRTVTGLHENGNRTPGGFSLSQNYPNPFNPSTVIGYQLPRRSYVNLTIYDLLGRKVATLVNKEMEAGPHTVTWNASGFSSGVYIARLTAGQFEAFARLIFIR